MKKVLIPIVFLEAFLSLHAYGQKEDIFDSIFPQGISIQYAYGSYSIRDEYISINRYTGMFPEYSVKWAHYHLNHGFEFEMSYGNSSSIKNYTTRSNIQELSLSGKHFYPWKETHLAGKPVYLFLGPSWDFFIHIRNQNMASSIFTKTISLASFISGGINIKGFMPIATKMQGECALNLPVLYFVARLPDLDVDEAKYAKILAVPWAVHTSFNVCFRYQISDSFSLGTGFQLQITRLYSSTETKRLDGWYGMVSANNNFFLSLLWHI